MFGRGGGSYTGDFERWMEGGLFYWGTLGYVKQGSEMGVYFHRGPTFGEHGWAFLSQGLLIRGILLGLLEIRKCPVDEYLSP